MVKIDVDKIMEKAKIAKVSDRKDIDLYTVDLSPAGYNASVDVEAKTPSEARKKVTENLQTSVDNGMFEQLMPKLPKTAKKDS